MKHKRALGTTHTTKPLSFSLFITGSYTIGPCDIYHVWQYVHSIMRSPKFCGILQQQYTGTVRHILVSFLISLPVLLVGKGESWPALVLRHL